MNVRDMKVVACVSLTEMYQFSVSEGAGVGTALGRVIATDADMGENTDMSYLIKDEEGGELFRVSTDGDTQEAVITIRKVDGRPLSRAISRSEGRPALRVCVCVCMLSDVQCNYCFITSSGDSTDMHRCT